MPGLTVDTSSPSPSTGSTPPIPIPPTYSPITPTLSTSELALPPSSTAQTANAPGPVRTFTHTQPSQTTISQPPPVPIDFDNNPDVLAIKSTIAVLLMQEKNALTDMATLNAMKERALRDPQEFMRALKAGEIQTAQDPLFNPSAMLTEDDEEEDEDGMEGGVKREAGEKAWKKIPAPQNVARVPPINWAQYGVVGESLDKIHADQVARPSEGSPGKLGPDGNYTFGEGTGPRRPSDLGIAAPYQPSKDKIDKVKGKGKSKSGKR